MIYHLSGWISVLISIFAIYPSYQPGANSVIGFYLALFSLLVAAFASHLGHALYYRAVFVFSIINVMFVNDGTNLSLLTSENDWVYIGSMYGIYIVVSSICGFLVSREDLLGNSMRRKQAKREQKRTA
ncbi:MULTISPECIES: hypothetical protein [Pseudoalteromonas]|uniref:Uncharacterized protein n=1 Tax=Pseudoalteromonas luteoviolacea (strain 2ta16) TaxID=1353533 RepID=V4JBG2_PSEL2|nr:MULTISPECIES: hypothetical protein [Pseudoalteromonas]ESP92457.1 hypothetical protein PL2TA16_04265 [Pseudoalteromonas luteoviolacea 2ta16]KZN35017.1 hypothetical protein N483_24040 [Pseudoalteromonas luteoviolacea NCIMB 1944]MCG7550689.1 hypothetical protein [Pseudoalteromonas sp. Of7M-16]